MKLPGYDGKYIQTGVQILKNIQEDIKSGKFKQVYLLYGEEAYLKQQYKRNLVKALNPDDDTMNFARYEGKGIDIRELISLFDTMPFFADHRLILLENTGFFKSASQELADYIPSLPGAGGLYEESSGLSLSGVL